MKILQLRLQAFGPFKNEINIDFERLNERGVFLLTGPTGVGKTSIFDAICFALYGEISGNTGIDKFAKVRSDYADTSVLTYVDLVFEINNSTFNIHRIPPQTRIGRGNKEVTQQHEVVLKTKDQVYEGIVEVNKQIIQLIGLNIEQFKQVVMLPQGEFVNFLIASSSEKMDIFRKIFQTYGAYELQQNLLLLAKDKKEAVEELKKKIEIKIESLRLDKTDLFQSSNLEAKINYINDLMLELKKECDIKENQYLLEEKTYQELQKKVHYMMRENEEILRLNKYKEELDGLIKAQPKIIEMKNIVNEHGKAKELEALDTQRQEIKLELQDLKKQQDNLIKDIAEATLQMNELAIKKQQCLEKKKNHPAYYLQVEKLKLEEQQILQQQEKEREMSDLEKKSSRFEEELFIKQNELKDIEMFEKVLLNSRIEYQELKENCQKIELEQSRILDDLDKTKIVLKQYGQIKSAKKSYIKANDDLIKEKQKLLNLEKLDNDLQALILDKKAYELSLKLKDNEPCPVCGSLSHPKKALQIQEINLSDKEDYKSKINAQTKIVNQLEMLLQSHKNEIEFCKKQLDIYDNIIKVYLINENNIDDVIKNIEEKTTDNKIKLHSLTAQLQEKEKSIHLYEKSADNKKVVLQELEEKRLQFYKVKEELLTLKTIYDSKKSIYTLQECHLQMDELLQKVQFEEEEFKKVEEKITNVNDQLVSKDSVLKMIEETLLQKEEVYHQRNLFFKQRQAESDLDSYQEKIKDETIINTLETEIATYENKLFYLKHSISELVAYENITPYDVPLVQKELNECKKKVDELLEYKTKIETIYTNNQSLQKEINHFYKMFENGFKESEKVIILSNLANGKNISRIDLEKYIILAYFEEIIYEANLKLKVMTNHRYELFRKKERLKGNTPAGLDIEVLDYYTGRYRDVRTLSGGESFKCALCLALGLAEVIKNNNGGIQLETMFIDEGFGSLDPESLDLAISTLNEMHFDGHVIGIISHVEVLKERIMCKICLESNQEGSYIKEIIV